MIQFWKSSNIWSFESCWEVFAGSIWYLPCLDRRTPVSMMICYLPRSLLKISTRIIFVYGVRKCSHFNLLHIVVQFFQNHLLKRLFFPIVYSCLLCQRKNTRMCVDLSPGFLSCSTDLYFCFCATTILPWWL